MAGNGAADEPGGRKKSLGRSISDTIEEDRAFGEEEWLGDEKVPVSRAGLVSRACFWWMWRIMLGLYKDGFSCLMSLSWWQEDAAETNVEMLEKAWIAELHSQGHSKASLARAMKTAYKKQLMKAALVIAVSFTFSFIGTACILRLLLDHISSADPDLMTGIGLVISLVVCELCRSFTFSLATSFNYLNGVRGRAAAMGLLYKKILNLRSLKDKTIGELVNMFSHDGQRVFEAMVNGPFTISGPLVFLAGSIYVGLLMGVWALVGVAAYILVFIVMKFLGDGMEHFRKRAVNLTGQRVGLMTEVLTCMKLIKMNGWEPAFINRLTESRHREKIALERGSFLKSVVASLVPMIPVIASVFMFLGYILTGNELTASRAFTVISVFYAMTFSLASSLYGVQSMIDVSVAMTRYKEILLMPEKTCHEKCSNDSLAVEVNVATLTWESPDEEEDCETTDRDSIIAGLKADEVKALSKSNPTLGSQAYRVEHPVQQDVTDNSFALLLKEKNGHAGDRKDSEGSFVPVLHEIDIKVKKGELIGVCGMKGSGKSSLLAAILGRMQILEGDIKVTGTAAFSSQDPWIMNGTARENILFGKTFDKERYDRIIKATRLDKDFDTFSAQDEVEIGDRGLTLSGGQKQRICLARAIYSNCDILLLDDPLSTVDVNMGRHIFAQCIKTILHEKTVFLVTHHLEYLPKCDKVLYLNEGHVVSFGTHADLMSSGSPYQELFSLYNNKYDRILKERMMYRDKKSEMRTVPQRGFSRVSKRNLNRQLSMMSMPVGVQQQFSVVSSNSISAEYENLDMEDLVISQRRPNCRVRSGTYWVYIQAMGGLHIFVFLLISFMVSIAIQSATTGYLAYWLNQGSGQRLSNVTWNSNPASDNLMLDNVANNPDRDTYALMYGMLLLAMLVILVARSFIFAKILLKASSYLHKKLIEKTLKSPMKFFDATPIGIILNRFSADLDEIDVRLPASCEMSLQNVFLVLSALVLISVMFPWVLLAILPLMVIFGVLAHMFAPILTQLKFIDNITRAPYLSHLAASVEGIATISSFDQGQRFYLKFFELLDRNSVPFFLFYGANRWLAVFLDCMTIIVTGATGFLIVFSLNSENSSQAGLALSFAIQISYFVQYTLRHSMETVSRFSSVQRIQDFIETLNIEGTIINNPQIPPATWPSDGAITFKNYKMRYSDSHSPVIKGITLNIQAREKIGIVGKSGSGKSSLGVALFRVAEAASGTILIDSINIRDVPLDVLRSRLSILVQDPVLFTGTIRYNLDPSEFITSDDVFWQALDKCHMKMKIHSLEHGLDTMVEENGRNFSMGERQLLCLARMLLRNSKIIVLDEATASVDSTTEVLVQQTIRDCFQNCTLLMIAHRINTVWDCDKVLVMEDGKAVEFNNPTDLLQKSFSRFKSMFEMMKSTPRGASINEDPVSVDRPTSSFRLATSPRLSSSSHLHSPTPLTQSASPMGDLSPLKDSDVYDDDDAVLEQ